MDWKRHSAIGIFSGIIVLLIFRNRVDIQLVGLGLFVAFIFSILPDIDHQNSKITWYLFSLYTLLNLVFFFLREELLIYSLLAQFVTLLFVRMPHRGPIHSLVVNGIFAGIFYFLTQNIILSVIAGVAYWSHMLADGIPFKLH